ncbi:MAG: hypothetical protein C0622_10795 [Desulfuromonas sp.]|nr:MAG: hypothetical protein C0622_10795 [Desulfuromonas sp.]
MIFVVDDEQASLELASVSLATEGYEVQTFSSADDALKAAGTTTPDLIISDIMMPEMDGFQFHEHYVSKFSYRHTPFIFLTCLSDPSTVIRGLDNGADDFLQKPILPDMLRAKVRSILRRTQTYISQSFSGDLAKMPFSKVMQFCELKDLTGWVDVASGEFSSRFQFKGGELLFEGAGEDIDTAFNLETGTFKIYLQPIDYKDIAEAAAVKQVKTGGRTDLEKPMGKLSGVQVKDRLFQIQTEFSSSDNQVVSVVILDGRVLMKRAKQADAGADRKALQAMIEEQHVEVEKEVHNKLDALTDKAEQRVSDSEKKFSDLYDAGFEKYREGNLKSALEFWEQAFEINPDNKTLQVNLSILKKKIAYKAGKIL